MFSTRVIRTARPRLLRRVAAVTLSVAVFGAACGSGDTDTADAPVVTGDAGDNAPGAWPHDFTADLVGGGTIDAGDFEGQDLVLWFWAPW